jgi:hypothetical protein
MKIFNVLLAMLLFASPFLIGWGIFVLLAPAGFYQVTLTFLICLFICGIEGFFAWLVGFALL